jgi:hypothetical protein
LLFDPGTLYASASPCSGGKASVMSVRGGGAYRWWARMPLAMIAALAIGATLVIDPAGAWHAALLRDDPTLVG